MREKCPNNSHRTYCKRSTPLPYYNPALEIDPAPSHHPTIPPENMEEYPYALEMKQLIVSESAHGITNSEHPDRTISYGQSELGLYSWHRHDCPSNQEILVDI